VDATLVSYSSAGESVKAVASLNATLSVMVRRLPPLEATARAASLNAARPRDHALHCMGMVQLDDGTFLVDAQTVDDLLEEQSELMREPRMIPEQQDGKVLGIRLFGVTPLSLLAVLGIENGDRIETINGYELTDPANAITAYESVRRKNDALVTLNRRGETVSLHYRIL
jgi:general secretion pathway protein C